MPIIKEVKPYCPCPNKPKESQYGAGTIWECDNCGGRFELQSDQREGGYCWVRIYTKGLTV